MGKHGMDPVWQVGYKNLAAKMLAALTQSALAVSNQEAESQRTLVSSAYNEGRDGNATGTSSAAGFFPPKFRAESCWPGFKPTDPTPMNVTVHDQTLSEGAFDGRVDVLQVTAIVDCVVQANVLSLHGKLASPFVHVVVTPDGVGCADLAGAWSHVRCVADEDILGSSVTMANITDELARVGPQAVSKGAPWYWQQFLKMAAVARGVGGLGEYVRIMDGDSLQLRPLDWFDSRGGEVFDVCDKCWAKGRAVGDGSNHVAYGALWNKLTGSRLIGSPALISHGMSVRASRMRALLTALSPPEEAWASMKWVLWSVGHLCDAAALTGFSEYWYYASWALRDNTFGSPQVRAPLPGLEESTTCIEGKVQPPEAPGAQLEGQQACRRFELPNRDCSKTPQEFLDWALASWPDGPAYVVLENHVSAEEIPHAH